LEQVVERHFPQVVVVDNLCGVRRRVRQLWRFVFAGECRNRARVTLFFDLVVVVDPRLLVDAIHEDELR